MTRKKGGQPDMELTKLSDPVQAALQKAAARKMRCAKPDPPEETPGPSSVSYGLGQVKGT